MADTKISGLAAVTDLQDTDEYVLARAGDTKKITGANLKAGVPTTPTGAAGGVLAGTYPNPTFAADMATQAELDAVAAAGVSTIIDSKGDLLVGTAADTLDNLAVGSNGQILTADSAQATGIKWAAAPGGGILATILDNKGDLIVASAADTPAILPLGTNGQILTAEPSGATGIKWADPVGIPRTVSDAKGDLIVGTADDAVSRLAVGSNSQVLTADSTQVTGVKWATPSAGGGGAWTLLSTTTLASPGTFDISSINGAYNDLILVLIARGVAASPSDSINLNFNGDATASYYAERLRGVGSTASAGAFGPNTAFSPGDVAAANAGANRFGAVETTIFGYASTTWKKVMHSMSYSPDNIGAGMNVYEWGGMWDNTAAITRIQVTAAGGNMVTGSQLRIYGRL